LRFRLRFLTLILLASTTVWSQGQQPQPRPEEQNPQAEQPAPAPQPPPPQQPQKRPTLGPAAAPSLRGPKTSTTLDHRRLARVRKVYIERMDNALDEKITELLAKTRRFRVVGDRREADAVLRGTCLDLRRLKVLRSEVYLNDVSGAAIWQDSVRRPIYPPTIAVAVSETASLIVSHLDDSLIEAERR